MARMTWRRRACLLCSAASIGVSGGAALAQPSKDFEIPAQPLSGALVQFGTESGFEIVADASLTATKNSHGAHGVANPNAALQQILGGTGLTYRKSDDQYVIVAAGAAPHAPSPAPAAPAQAGVETVVVTAQHKHEDIQSVPIAVTALSQQQLTERQIAGGPDLLRDVPNMNFTKTNFSGYDIQLRGIGTQAISVTTDPAVAVAFNDTPFIRNHFFEQEFYDLQDAEVLLGPQGTLYGRNATAGVVNLKSALPTDTYEAMLSADLGNYSNRRLEGMLNLPISGDQLDIRVAGEWTKRDGYTEDTTANTSVDGRDLWSSRVTIGWKPASNFQVYAIWEHFSEDDDRLRSGKQLCKTDWGPGGSPSDPGGSINGQPKPFGPGGEILENAGDFFSQGCLPTSLYSPSAFEEPIAYTLPYVAGAEFVGGATSNNPYPSQTQSTNLRQIQEDVLPQYKAKNDTLELNSTYQITPQLNLASQTGFNNDFLWSFEDYNRFAGVPGFFGVPFCDPQLGCSTSLLIDDLSAEHAWQASQEFRLASSFDGPFNFSIGANYLHYETVEDYYVFSNAFTALERCSASNNPNSSVCLNDRYAYNTTTPNTVDLLQTASGGYIDPNPLSNLNNEGHNYFLSQNPYVLNSYAMFGEAYYNFTNDLKFTAGLRWTDDQKHFLDIPSWLVESGYGYPVAAQVNQQWDQWTGRSVLNWTPQTDFTDQTMVYGSYSHGYKAGGANPPGAIYTDSTEQLQPDHPLTFKPEFIDAFEIGSKNTLLDDSLTLNGDVFFYDYKNYQISEIVDRTAINNNYNATADGAELTSNWEPMPGLKFSFSGGYENTRINNGQYAIDLMDRTAGMPGWVVVRPYLNQSSNCIFPTYVAEWIDTGTPSIGASATSYCEHAYRDGLDPLTGLPYVPNPTVGSYNQGGSLQTYTGTPIVGYPGFNPLTAPNDGEGFAKSLGGNQLPNAPHFTTSLTAEYSMPVMDDWMATFHTDLYWQSQSWWRVFNDNNYDKLHGYSNVNLSLILNSTNGWQVMAYVKNVFNVTAITGAFLNSDDSDLTTNVFLTDPRLFGVRVTKQLDQGDGFWGADYTGYDVFTDLFSDTDNGKPMLWVEFGGDLNTITGQGAVFTPPFLAANPSSPVLGGGASPTKAQQPPLAAPGEEATITFQPDGSDWQILASVRYARSNVSRHAHGQLQRYYTGVHKYKPFTHLAGRYPLFSDTIAGGGEKNLLLDFEVGKDVGIGLFGDNDTSTVDFGIRMAQFSSSKGAQIHSIPQIHPYYLEGVPLQAFHSYAFLGHASRNFHGVGPTISWNGDVPIFELGDRQIAVDWGANGALLFGRQSANVEHKTTGYYRNLKVQLSPYQTYQKSKGPIERGKNVLVPNIGGFAGLSYRYQNAKISFGYRADVFFGAMDGGVDAHHSETINMSGPFANISIGLGG